MNWMEIKDTSDIEYLLERFGYFHDGCLREMYMWTGTYVNEDLSMEVPGELDTNVKLLFQRQYANPSAIEILFEGVTGIRIIPSPENYDSIIIDAVILKIEDNFYWADNYDWHPKENADNYSNWISAKQMKWREVNDWMGKQNRYELKNIPK
ncbi:hypothetical protein FC756_18465 [Lysinibacillus mangiferihumi]|uniref:Uncharacterized protein n=1 Tax=Lysinibacillus mangiferihumi TaxID=1130819 RepID=A0A4V5TLV8_9BACI|nr:hypothetical protein [Lysinibacillus mangiferihumi]TKI63283.1 hypothetical protein FC756_18465 [Lysinibacillus mangiferihumi]